LKIFDAKQVYDSGIKKYSLSAERFFVVWNLWIAIMKWKSLAEKTYNHIAFKIDEKDFDIYLEKIENFWLEFKKPRWRIDWEWRSIYFYDFDNHLFELHTGTLEERLENYGD
jgi:hypothetical protein